MSNPRGYFGGTSMRANVAQQMDVNLNFVVDSANGNGLGIRSLKSNGFVESVFMHTSATPGKVGTKTNPNPAVGYALVTFKNNFNKYLGGFSGEIAPLASTNLTSTTSGSPYVITSIGTTTTAQFQAAGLPPGIAPAVGVAFIAIATGAIGGTGTVGAPSVPSDILFSVIGDPNQSIANSNISQNAGAQVLVQMTAPTNSSTTTLIPTAPADGTVIGMTFRFDGSSVTVDGL